MRRDARGSGAAFEHRPKIGAGALRLDPRGLGSLAEAEIAVDQAGTMMVLGGDTGGGKRVGIGLALVAQRIEPCRAYDRRREPREVLRAQRRNAPVDAVLCVLEIVA